jgi:hypothetical protein
MKGIVGHGPSTQYSENFGTTRLGPGERFEYENCGAFAKVQPLAILVKGTAGAWV